MPRREVGLNDPSRFITMAAATEALRLYETDGFKITHEWSGTVALAPDRMPAVGPIDGRSFWMCGAYAGAGSVASWVCAREVVDAISERTTISDDAQAFSIERWRLGARYAA